MLFFLSNNYECLAPTMWYKYTSYLISKHTDGERDDEFSTGNILKVLDQAYQSIKYNIPHSSLIWVQYRDFVSIGLEHESTIKDTQRKLDEMYLERLSIPHKTLQETYVDYSTFVTSTFRDNAVYEGKMKTSYKVYSKALESLQLREKWESIVSKENSIANYAAYIQWEITLTPMKLQSPELTMALYERALQYYPEIHEIWDDYILYVSEKAFSPDKISSIVDRGLLACHYSGLLWAHRLRINIIQGASVDQLEEMKNAFLGKRLMETPDHYQDWKVFMIEWLSYQTRPECEKSDSQEENLLLDCQMAVERIKQQGYSDTDFVIEKIIFNIFKSFGFDEVSWRDFVKTHGDKAEYWINRLDAEIESKHSLDSIRQTFGAALRRKKLDFPEKILEKRVEFERKFGNSLDIQKALAFLRIKSKIVQHNRMESVSPEPTGEVILHPVEIIDSNSLKRKHDDTDMADDTNATAESLREVALNEKETKAPKHEHVPEKGGRSRENNTVIVSNLPSTATEQNVTQFFKECGEIQSLSLNNENVAIIEFSDHQSALSALTKNHKKFKKTEITVNIGEETTVWVTNFPPDYTEEKIRSLFDNYGTIMSVRFPSLKFNTHRRFCYVQFSDANSAHKAAAELDGELVGKFTLQVKISNPAKKNERSGAMYEDREVFVKGLDFNKVDEKELREMLAEFGTIEKVRLPLSQGNEKLGRLHDGYGFVVFETAAAANSAIKFMDGRKAGSRKIHMSLSSHRAAAPKTVSKVLLDVPMNEGNSATISAEINSRTLVISNLADTINDTQLQGVFEKYGPLKQIVLQPKLNNAKVEYVNVADAGKAELALQGYEIGGQAIHIGAPTGNPKGNKTQKPATSFVPRSLLRKKRI